VSRQAVYKALLHDGTPLSEWPLQLA